MQRRRGRPALIDNDTPYVDDARARYVVAHHPEGLNSEQIAELLGVRKQTVWKTERKALRKVVAELQRIAAAESNPEPESLADCFEAPVRGPVGDWAPD